MEEQSYPCPSCGFEVFEEPAGSYDICPLCNWEDDHVQLQHPAMAGGANKLSLARHQQRALSQFPASLTTINGFVRAPRWRPLQAYEIASPSVPASDSAYFEAAANDSPQYYWLRKEEL